MSQLNVSEKTIHLRELLRNASSVRKLYETFLGRLKEVGQQETFPMQGVRVIAQATPPASPSNMSGLLITGASLGVGLLMGLIIAILRERLDHSIRDADDAQMVTGLRVLALCNSSPLVGRRKATLAAHPQDLWQLRMALSRNMKKDANVIGVTGLGDSKDSMALKIAECFANSGINVMLVDCCPGDPTLSLKLCPNENLGLPDVLAGGLTWREAIMKNGDNSLAYISANSNIAVAHSHELIAGPMFEKFVKEVSGAYDLVLLNLPPLNSTSELEIAARVAHQSFLAMSAGVTKRQDLQKMLDRVPEVWARMTGLAFDLSAGRKPPSRWWDSLGPALAGKRVV